VLALKLRIKLENCFEEFGVCAHFVKANECKDYILFNTKGEILDISENVYHSIFSQICSLSKFHLRKVKEKRLLSMSNLTFFFIRSIEEAKHL